MIFRSTLTLLAYLAPTIVSAQTPPSETELRAYTGLHAAAARGDLDIIHQLANTDGLRRVDANGRTPLHVAVFAGNRDAARVLLRQGADPKALDAQKYDVVTIAAVRNDVDMLRLLLSAGGDATLITSPYDGTALIAAAHLGHAEVVRILIGAGAPLDHVNNLGWTALIEAIVLGDGGPRHIACLRALVEAGADITIPDRQGVRPLQLARQRGYTEMVRILETAGRR